MTSPATSGELGYGGQVAGPQLDQSAKRLVAASRPGSAYAGQSVLPPLPGHSLAQSFPAR